MSNDRSARQLIHKYVCTNNLILGSINYIELGYWSLSHPFWKIMDHAQTSNVSKCQ